MSEHFGKAYKLCSKIQIDAIFEDKKTIKTFPFVLYYKEIDTTYDVPFKIVISAPKRNHRKAVHRNRVKRIIKEVLRKNKADLESFLLQSDKKLALFLIYTSKDLPAYDLLEKKIIVLLNRLIEQIK